MTITVPLLNQSSSRKLTREDQLQQNCERIDEIQQLFHNRYSWISWVSTLLCPITCCLKNTICCCCVCSNHQSVSRVDLCWHALNPKNACCQISEASRICLLKHEKEEQDRLLNDNVQLRREIDQARDDAQTKKIREQAIDDQRRLRDEKAWEQRLAFELALSKQKAKPPKYPIPSSKLKDPYHCLYDDPLNGSWWNN